ncbi:MAG: hypothetical protein HC897_08925 [Thermoanaerobaculia bacterium]|nr:hypothetical protein [Thermoanaerobaculia bacterium]
MRKQAIYLVCVLCGLAAWLAAPVWAEESEDGSFTGEFSIGYRSVSVDGTENKYKEDINLDDGPRLFGLRMEWVPSLGLRSKVDRISVDVSNFGGDPFETFGLKVQKYGRYDFDYRRTESDYFYQDIILPPELGSASLSNAGDFHHFDFRRVRDLASFKYRFNDRARFDVGFERFTKRGESTTTLDIQRDEFELDKPVHESFDELQLAFQYAWPKVTLTLEERVRNYQNDVEIFLPGSSPGENTTNLARLDFFLLDQPYEYDSNQHTVRLTAKPTDRWIIQAAGSVQSLDLDIAASEDSRGIGFNGQPFVTDLTGGGEIERDVDFFDVDVTYLVNDRFAVVGSARRYSLDQEGVFFFGTARNEGVWEIDTTGFEAGLQYNLSATVTLGAGVRTESRDVTFGSVEGSGEVELEDETTDQTGFYANVAWRPSKQFELTADVEDSSYDDPFALVSPTDRQRYQLKARYKRDNGFFFDGSYALRSYENSDSGWDSDYDQLTARSVTRRKTCTPRWVTR